MSSVESENKYLDPSTSSTSYLNDAKALLERGGSLTEVGLMLEAAIQKGDLGQGGYEAWILLGEVRSMDEREDASMRALNEGVKRAAEVGAAGEGMIVSNKSSPELDSTLWTSYIPLAVRSPYFSSWMNTTNLPLSAKRAPEIWPLFYNVCHIFPCYVLPASFNHWRAGRHPWLGWTSTC